ncbi:hypothetical protein [Buttiauxella izardii]|uniref:hypothetical protein n=1 Tax=Buttiauxella izardii TaxID=82991 RepID=UPI0011C21456|nr:hypothetical protein [Buttiauxella izardii]
MKLLLVTVTTAISLTLLPFACSANADSLGINKDCDNHPASQYGIDSIVAFGEYKADPKKFMDAMAAFCNKGKTMGDMGFDAADEHSLYLCKQPAGKRSCCTLAFKVHQAVENKAR